MVDSPFALRWPPSEAADVPAHLYGLSTTRRSGLSAPPYASLNLGDHVGDDPRRVEANRQRLAEFLPPDVEAPSFRWLHQVHGTDVIDAAAHHKSKPTADGAFTTEAGIACTILTADCLPILFWNRQGSAVAAAHAGWRGLADGIIEATIDAMPSPPSSLCAWLGPAIGPDAFEVGADVLHAFTTSDPGATAFFSSSPSPDDQPRWLADLPGLATRRLKRLGLHAIFQGSRCTFSHPRDFFSYRRDGTTGRMATAIWIHP